MPSAYHHTAHVGVCILRCLAALVLGVMLFGCASTPAKTPTMGTHYEFVIVTNQRGELVRAYVLLMPLDHSAVGAKFAFQVPDRMPTPVGELTVYASGYQEYSRRHWFCAEECRHPLVVLEPLPRLDPMEEA